MRRHLLFVVVLLVAVAAIACSPEETSQQGEQDSQQPTREGTVPAPETPTSDPAEAAAVGLGEVIELGDLSMRVFDIRTEESAYYMSEPGEAPGSGDSSSGEEYVAVDYVVENESGSTQTLQADATLNDDQGDPYAADPSIDPPGASFDGLEVDSGSKRASTAYFNVPSDETPERLLLVYSGDEEAEIDLTNDERGEIPSEDYLYVYHHYLTNNYYEEAYEMLLDPAEEQDVSLGEWLTFYEPLWGERYIVLDSGEPLSSGSEKAAFFMERTFYGGDGAPIPDDEVNANTEQELVREGDEWKIVMRDDLAQDILVSSEPSTPEAKEEAASADEGEEQSEAAESKPGSSPDSSEEGLANLGTVVTVSRVVDGDTVEISPAIDGIADVRLIGVDTPESHGGAEPYGQEASNFTTEQLEGEQVALEFDVETVDRYGRLLAYVWLPDGSFFNEVLLEEGYAQVATFPPNVRYVERLLAAQEQARSEGRGLWGLSEGELCELADRGNGIGGGCEEGQTPQSTPSPATGGTGVPPISQNDCPSEAPIKGNESSSGELIYHPPEGQFYDVTNPEECFATPEDAEAAGYRASER